MTAGRNARGTDRHDRHADALLPAVKPVWDAGRARGIGLHEAESRRDRDPAEAATEAGRAVADHLGVPFHFPGPDDPGYDAPRRRP